jgi:hypothetical protein
VVVHRQSLYIAVVGLADFVEDKKKQGRQMIRLS